MVKDNNREGIGLMIWESGEFYFGKYLYTFYNQLIKLLFSALFINYL